MTTLNWEKMSMVKATKTLWGQGGALASLRGLLGGRDELVIDVATNLTLTPTLTPTPTLTSTLTLSLSLSLTLTLTLALTLTR